ncbi:S41 family peptidase [Cohnella fermenti]|uniref:PDZ domain-containing protein n=1 Tax=Cohnella fermenti TaxID=2565925 RepID=A0A4S4BZL0_9BACL|nr:S41 family peptidase [Cohnella fermenti]THF80747.1 PDZ domain-containing protein [Cohnella fermenti]
MMFRGRTVLAIILLTALATVIATIGAIGLSGNTNWSFGAGFSSGSSKGSAASEDEGWNRAELKKLNEAFELIKEKYLLPIDREKLLDGAVSGMVSSLGDPYSAYYSAADASKFTDSVQGTFTGIGARLDLIEGAVVIEKVIKGMPAERAGLRVGDILLSVNGESLESLSLSETIAKIRGPKGTKAKLTVKRIGVDELLELELVRDRIVEETVGSEVGADGIAYLWISQFTFDTPKLVEAELQALENTGFRALVIDVRDNPGGVLTAVEDIAKLFVPEGRTIVIEEDSLGRQNKIVSEGASDSASRGQYPLIVLMNGGSASASEILAGALKQSAGAVLVGSQSYGKGTVQISYENELGDGSLLKLTVSKWLLPDGTWLNGKGIEPDIEVEMPDYYSVSVLSRDHDLKRDETGEDVRSLQIMLEGAGYEPGRKDGYYSESTEQAVLAFQKDAKLPETGIVDAATADKLEDTLSLRMQKLENDPGWQAARARALEEIRG